jgi:hypothetical protein
MKQKKSRCKRDYIAAFNYSCNLKCVALMYGFKKTDALVKKVNVDLLMKREKYTGSKSYPSGNYHQPEPQYEPIIFVKK